MSGAAGSRTRPGWREAVHPGARIVLEGEAVVEVDYTRWSAGRSPAEGWLERLAGPTAVREVDLRSTTASAAEVVRVVESLPAIAVLSVDRGVLYAAALARIRALRPELALRLL
ncbi:hypothetical protein [Nannocystis pusilla]|uniref:hypothetical protein n=1 Tax=Nannocystis pusilla TaxID=889268 RepID=UPI003BF442BA